MPLPPPVHIDLHLQIDNCCQDCCNGSFNNLTLCPDNARIIAIDNETLAPEKRSFLSRLFCCCCFRPNAEEQLEQNKLAAKKFENYLQQQYGELPSSLGLRFVDFDLKNKQESGSPLLVKDAQESLQACEDTQQKLKNLKNMVKAVQYYSNYDLPSDKRLPEQKHSKEEKPDKAEDSDLSLSSETSSESEDFGIKSSKSKKSKENMVIKRSGKEEAFQEDKLRKGLTEAPTATPLTLKQIDQILGKIKHQLLQTDGKKITSEKISRIALHQMKKQGISLRPPKLLDVIKDKEMLEKLSSSRLEQLGKDDLFSLLILSQQKV